MGGSSGKWLRLRGDQTRVHGSGSNLGTDTDMSTSCECLADLKLFGQIPFPTFSPCEGEVCPNSNLEQGVGHYKWRSTDSSPSMQHENGEM